MHPAALLALLVTASAPAPVPLSTPAPIAVPAPAQNAAVDARARDWFSRLQHNRIDYSQLDDTARMPLNSDVAIIIASQWSTLGDPLSFDEIRVETSTTDATGDATGGDTVYVYHLIFRNDVALDFYFGIDPSGLISGLRLAPEQ